MPNATEASINRIIRTAILDCIASNGNPEQASGNEDCAAANSWSKSDQSGAQRPMANDLEPEALFTSPAAEAIKEEILRAGKKLWQRAYVDIRLY